MVEDFQQTLTPKRFPGNLKEPGNYDDPRGGKDPRYKRYH